MGREIYVRSMMFFDKKEASKTMYLAHIPDAKEKKIK
jgi:hypothetical protein